MGDLAFSENLMMLHDGELSQWVKTIFGMIKAGTRIRIAKAFRLGNYLIENVLLTNPIIRAKAIEMAKYTSDRVDRRLEREVPYPDLMSKILEKDGMEKQLLRGEYYSNASLFMVAGTETTATALSGITYVHSHLHSQS